MYLIKKIKSFNTMKKAFRNWRTLGGEEIHKIVKLHEAKNYIVELSSLKENKCKQNYKVSMFEYDDEAFEFKEKGTAYHEHIKEAKDDVKETIKQIEAEIPVFKEV